MAETRDIKRTLFGTSDGSLDAKSGRITIPSDMTDLRTANVRITADPLRRYLEIRTREAFEALVRRIETVAATLPSDAAEALLTDYLGFSGESQVDASWRLVLPKRLREILGGETDLVLCGAGDCLQVWPVGLWQQEQENRQAALKREYHRIAHAILGVGTAAVPPAADPEPVG